MALATNPPFRQYTGLDGQPMNSGSLFFGVANQNPETAPVTVYWDAAATQPAAQPIKTLNGYPARNGTPAQVYATGDYSITVRDVNGVMMFTANQASVFDAGTQIKTDLAASSGAAQIGGGDQVVNSIVALRALLKTSASKYAFVTGYYAAGDGGGGDYWYDSTDTTSADNGGTIIVATDGGRWKLVVTDTISVKQFGAKGDGITNDLAAIQAAHAAIVATGRFGVLTLPSGNIFKCNTGLTLNVSLVRIDANGSALDFSGMTGSGIAITLTGSGTGTPYKQAIGGICRADIVGPGSGSLVDGLHFNTSAESGPSHINLEGSNVHGFRVGNTFLNNAYIINNIGGSIYDCATATTQPSGFANFGERITYIGASLFNNTLAVDMQNANGAYVFEACSLDYNGRQVFLNAGRVFLNNCHVEASNYAQEPFGVGPADGSTLVMQGGWLLCTGTNTTSIVNCTTTAAKGGGAFFRDVFMNNISTAKYFATGSGNVEVSNPITFNTPANFPILLQASASLFMDGGFEQATPEDVFLTADSAAITSRLTGACLVLSSVASNPRSGVKALKAAKAFGAGTASQFAAVAPLRAGKRYAGVRMYYSKPGAQTGTMFVTYCFIALRDDKATPTILKVSSATGLVTVTFTAAAVSYTEIAGGFDVGHAPSWATHVAFLVNMNDVNAGDVYFDDFEAYEF